MSEKIEDTVIRLGGNICGVIVKTEDWLAAVTDYGYAWFDEQKFKTAENNTIDYDTIHDVLRKVWSRELIADEGLDIIENIVE